MKAQNINFRRETFTEDDTKDVLNLYDEYGNIVVSSDAIPSEQTISLVHDGFVIVASPESKEKGEDFVFITVSSIKNNIRQ
jgi:hypothetical protein